MIKQNRKLIKVTASILHENKSSVSKGISKLKRGQDAFDFIRGFLAERGVTSYTLNMRYETWSTMPIINNEEKMVITYHFTGFLSQDLAFYAKDLTKEELMRDLPKLKDIING